MLEQLTDRLEDYFNNSKQEFSFGVQNFQGIREYTKIPLAPLTLLYGQNSAGKSTIHDAIEFIHGFFSEKWDEETVKLHLNRWANQNRVSQPLSKNYLGKQQDVVISASTIIETDDFWAWEQSHSNIKHSATGLSDILFNKESGIPFRMDVHFSDDTGGWYIRECRLLLCGEVFADFVFDDWFGRDIDSYGLLKINKNHPIYDLIDSYYDGGLKVISKQPYHNEGEKDWFLFFDMDVNQAVTWKNQFCWSEVDECLLDRKPTADIIEFRSFLLAMLQIPSFSISKRFSFSSIPPLRPIPSKLGAVFRFRFNHLQRLQQNEGWRLIAEQVLHKFLHDKEGYGFKSGVFADLDKINNWLSHEMYLATGYELTGECFLTLPGDLFFDSHTSISQKVETGNIEYEVHLKLVNSTNNQLIELEDVGVGISQVIPVLVALTTGLDFWSDDLRAFIQQPELHLHPRLQAHLADVFIESVNDQISKKKNPCFISESHSEHFLLRLLRRIRETHKSDIRHKLFGLSSDQVSVLYVDKLADGSSKIFPLRISPDGEFIDRWPHGFFTERDGELFDE